MLSENGIFDDNKKTIPLKMKKIEKLICAKITKYTFDNFHFNHFSVKMINKKETS
jgi:carbonic anhydrase